MLEFALALCIFGEYIYPDRYDYSLPPFGMADSSNVAMTKEQEAQMYAQEQPPVNMSVSYAPAATQPVSFVSGSVVDPADLITDARVFAVVFAVIFGVLGPLSLVFSIPACIFAFRSRRYLKEMKYESARSGSLAAIYLTIAAIVMGFFTLTCIVAIPLALRFLWTPFRG